MTTESSLPRSRRAILAGVLGAAAASVASAIGRPGPAKAVSPPIYMDQNNTPVSGETSIETSLEIGHVFIGSHLGNGTGLYGYSGGGTGILGQSDGTLGTGVFGKAIVGNSVGVYGQGPGGSGTAFGVIGESASTSGTGMYGVANSPSGTTFGVRGRSYSASGTAVHGWASSSTGATNGVMGRTASDAGIGVYGLSDSLTGSTRGVVGFTESSFGTGVQGASGLDTLPDAAPSTGVYGAAVGTASRGVLGTTTVGTGVHGFSGTGSLPAAAAKTGVYGYGDIDADARGVWGRSNAGRGVFGQATSGQGVRGYSATGSALYGATSGLKKGFALRAIGRVKLDQCAGIATINSGNLSQTVTPGIDLTSTSAVTATLMGDAGGSTTVKRVAVNATNDTFTIYLTAAATANVKVAWHVFG